MWKLSECLSSLNQIVSLGQIALLARVGSTKIGIVHLCAPAERYALPMHIVIPVTCPPRNRPFDRGSRNRRGGSPVRSLLDLRSKLWGQNHQHGR